MPARSSAARATVDPRSAVWTSFRAPRNRPMAVRTALTNTTGDDMKGVQPFLARFARRGEAGRGRPAGGGAALLAVNRCSSPTATGEASRP